MSDAAHPDPVIQFATEIKQLIANANKPLEQRLSHLEQEVDELRRRVESLETHPR